MSGLDEDKLSDSAKALVRNSGALANLKHVSFDGSKEMKVRGLDSLKQQAQNTIDDIQQLLEGGKLDSSTSLKLSTMLTKLRGALENGKVSPVALAAAIAEAGSALTSAEEKGISAQQKIEKEWRQVEAKNTAIDDDFQKMHDAGVNFSDKLWNRHTELTQYLKTHLHDLKTQKELDAVDDALLMQAEPQLGQYPKAKAFFDDAQTKSNERHELVDRDLSMAERKDRAADVAALDFDSDVKKSGNLTMDDVKSQSIGSKIINNDSEKFVRKQTNVYLRTKPIESCDICCEQLMLCA